MDEYELDDFEIDLLRNSDSDKDVISSDVLICECMCVSAGDIKELFKNSQIVDLKILREQFCVGQGCSSCLKTFEQWKDKIF